MDTYRDEKELRGPKLEKITRDTWRRFSELFCARAGIFNCRIPLRIPRSVVTQNTYPDCTTAEAAWAKYDTDNQKVHDPLMLALSNCQEGRNVLAGYIFNPDLADKSNPAAHADDGRGAYLQLEKNANGGSSTTANVYMRHLFDIDKALPIKEKVLAHTDAYRRLLLCEEPSRTLDALMKGHLLYLLGNDPHYSSYVVVEHESSKPGVSYDDAVNMITALNNRLEATSPAAPEMGTALVGRPSRRLTDEQKKKAKCHNCGQIGHIRPDCPTKPSKSPGKSDQARVAAAEKKMNGSKSKQSKQQSSSASEGDDSDYVRRYRVLCSTLSIFVSW
jgi:hypothetical protein